MNSGFSRPLMKGGDPMNVTITSADLMKLRPLEDWAKVQGVGRNVQFIDGKHTLFLLNLGPPDMTALQGKLRHGRFHFDEIGMTATDITEEVAAGVVEKVAA